jgi:hypothetical protein
MEETLINKGIVEKLAKGEKNLTFYIIINKAETLNKP